MSNSSYSWYANNVFYGNSATINPGYTLNNAGDSVTIKMVAVSLYGCKNDSLQHKFFTIPSVLTAFTMSDSIGCGPLTVGFTNNTPNIGFFTYAWNFGNNQTSILAQPNNVTFQSNPNFGDTTYFVKLTATSKCESVIKTKTITVKSKPKSIFTPSKTTGCSPITVTFTNLTKGLGVNYIWDFGDGNSHITRLQGAPYPLTMITNTYRSEGEKKVSLTIKWSGFWRAGAMSAPINGAITQRATKEITVRPAGTTYIP